MAMRRYPTADDYDTERKARRDDDAYWELALQPAARRILDGCDGLSWAAKHKLLHESGEFDIQQATDMLKEITP